jgi:rubrerythrin
MGWQQLKQAIDANRKEAEDEASQPITECPECGFNELKENKNKALLCPICGWTGRR